MTESKPKESPALRAPGPKKKLGLVVPPALKLPHEELIRPEAPPDTSPGRISVPSLTRQPSRSSPSSQTRQGKPGAPTAGVPVAPGRDFTKVPNSIGREAVPAGLFKGKSKQLYDALYGLTRGHVVAKRKVRIARTKLMRLAHIGARVTFDANVNHLRAVGLIGVTVFTGEHDGNEYEVFIPEELGGLTGLTRQGSQSSPASKEDRLDTLEASQTSQTLSVASAEPSSGPQTFFKTEEQKLDDEAAPLARALTRAERELTGKVTSEASRWDDLADVLVTELKLAAGRTTVSSVPAFLAEHLRRRLWKKEKRQIEDEGAKEQQVTAPKVDASKCPDCFGTGMWYPEGFEKGVARCRHEKLMAPTAPPAAAAPSSAAAAEPPTDEELVGMAVGFLHQGMNEEAVEQLLSASITPERWPAIRAAVLERYEHERGHVRPPG